MVPQGSALPQGGTIEYQQCNNPHVHENVHIATVSQHHTLVEIGEKLQQNGLELDTVNKYVSWVHREEHFQPESHDEKLDYWEKEWKNGHRSSDHAVLCQLPLFNTQGPGTTLWRPQPASREQAIEEGSGFLKKYTSDVQGVFSRCRHHWHPRDLKTGVRRPIWGCLFKKTSISARPSSPKNSTWSQKSYALATVASWFCACQAAEMHWAKLLANALISGCLGR